MRGDDLLAAGKAVSIFLPDSIHGAGINRNGRVEVGITPENPGRELSAGVG